MSTPAFRRPARIPLLLAILAAAWLGALPPARAADERAARRPFDVPAGAAEKTLKIFSDQAGQGLIADAELLKKVRTNRIVGTFTGAEALGKMLAGTGLVAAEDAQTGGFTVRREDPRPNAQGATPLNQPGVRPDSAHEIRSTAAAATASAAAMAGATASTDGTVTMSIFEVSTARDHGYMSSAAGSAGRMGQDLKDIPQSLTVINPELIRDLAPNSLDDILAYTSGVDAPGDDAEQYTMRGNSASVPLTNGFRAPRQFPGDVADVERVEILDGPSAAMYGDVSGNGGIINKVTKKPRFQPAQSVRVQYTDDLEQFYAEVDVNRPIGHREKAAFRVLVVGSDSSRQHEKDFSYRKTLQVMPKFLYRFNPTTQFVIESSFMKGTQSLGQQLGLNYDYVLYRNPRTGAYGTAASTTTAGVTTANIPTIINTSDAANPEAHLVDGKLFAGRVNFALTTQLSEHWSFQWSGLAAQGRTKWHIPMVAATLNADGHTINRGRPTERDRIVDNLFLDGDGFGRYPFQGGRLDLRGNVEYGYDHAPNHVRRQSTNTAIVPFDFSSPDYNVRYNDALFVEQTMAVSNTFNRSALGSAYLSLLDGKLLLNDSERWMKITQTGRAIASPRTIANSPVYTQPMYGAMFRMIPTASLYYSHTEGLQASTTAQANGILLPPTLNHQDEYGIKTQWFGDRVWFNVDYFENRTVNILEDDPITHDQVPAGEETAKGYDVHLQAQVRGWQLLGSYTHTVKQRTADLDPTVLNSIFTGFARHRAAVLLTYSFPAGPLRGMRIGAGTHYQSKRDLTFATARVLGFAVPQSMTYDFLASYRPTGQRYDFQVNVKNLTDEVWYPKGTVQRFTVGIPRTVAIGAGYRF